MDSPDKEVVLEYFLLSSVILIYLIIIRLFTPMLAPPDPAFYVHNDHYHYINMAKDPIKALNRVAIAPFCYRILTPFLAWLLPFDLIINFQIIAYTSIFLCGIVLYQIFKDYFSKTLSFTGVTLFYCLDWTAFYVLFNFWVTEALAFFFILLCFWAIKKSNFKVYSISLLLGVLTKEIVIITIPVLLISEISKLEEKKRLIELLFKSYIAVAPAFIALILVRIFVVPIQSGYYNYSRLFQLIGIEKRISGFKLRDIYLYTIAPWGLMILIFSVYNKKLTLKKWLKLYGVFIILVYSQLFFATDTERLIMVAFFPMIFITVSGMRHLSEEKKIKEINFFILSNIYLVFQIVTNYIGIFNI